MEGKTILGYTLQRRLGIGGMAEVWYAENVIGKKAAVKILLPKFCVDETVVERFMTEAKVMVDLNHPNIRQVYDYSEIDDRPAIIMEYLEGDDLKARMKAGQRFTETELEKWWNQLVDALKYTHEEGIVHRDIKPGNIFVDKKGNVKLLDFGIAKVRESISSTQTGQKIGTLMYMSPEQVKDSKHIDYHTDIYSLAVTFVHIITGKKPYDSDTSSDYDIQTSIVTQPLDLNGVPEGWKGFLAPYLEKEPSKRPELRYFEAVVLERKPIEQPNSDDEETIVESSPKKPEHSENSKKKNKLGLWIGLAVAAVAIGVIVVLNLPDRDTELYDNCRSVADYRGYVSKYGEDGKHYNEAKSFIDSYVADSTNKAQKAQAEAEAKAKAKAEQEAKEKKEKEAQVKAAAEAKAKARKEAEAKAFTNKTFTINGVSFEMIAVKGGTFTMGCTSEQNEDCFKNEKPAHSVALSDYYIGKFQVTQELWRAVMDNEPAYNGGWTKELGRGDNYPAYRVSWEDVQEFLTKLNQKTGISFRLPTEAEWEFAARGGNKGNGYRYSGSNNIDDVAWYYNNSMRKTHPVGTKLPNELGIYDMNGNVWEWCQDWYGDYSSGIQIDPTGPSSGSEHVMRGAGYYCIEFDCRVSDRNHSTGKSSDFGFRLAAGK